MADKMEELKFVVVGDGRIGKTSMLLTFRDNKYPGDCVPTVFDSYLVELKCEGKMYFLSLWDTAGQSDYDSARPLAYPLTDVFIICYSISQPESYRNARDKWFPEVRRHSPKVPVLLVGTKSDLRPGEQVLEEHKQFVTEDCVSYHDGVQLADKMRAAKYVECSSSTGKNIKHVFEEAVNAYLYKGNETYQPKKRKFLPAKCVIL